MKIHSLQDLFDLELRQIYDCEQKLVKKGLPTMAGAATSAELRNALEQHLQETRTHVTRLEQVFSIIGKKADTESNDILDEMTDQAEDLIKNSDSAAVRDAALIASGNQVEHFEIASYGSLMAFAEQLGFTEAVSLLQQTLKEEKAADAKLTSIAQTSVNPKATQLRAA
jgi:ferritin-like metal-binding protein YciE